MTTASTLFQESKGRTWSSLHSSATARNKSSQMAAKTYLTSYTKVR